MYGSFLLDKHEEEKLLGTLELSLDIVSRAQFYSWLNSYLGAFFPHFFFGCVQESKIDGLELLDGFAGPLQQEASDKNKNLYSDISLRIIKELSPACSFPAIIDLSKDAVLPSKLNALILSSSIENVLLSRLALSDKSAYFLIFLGVPNHHDRSKIFYLLKLLQPHVLMALIRTRLVTNSLEVLPQGRRDLSSREIEILKCIAKGKSNHQTAEALFLSPFTVKNHVHNILKKLGAKNRMEAVAIFNM